MITEKLSEDALKFIIDHNAVPDDERERLYLKNHTKD